eukprot:135214_1
MKCQTHKASSTFELFDVVYSEMTMSEMMVRTFVHQLMTQLEEVEVAVIEPSDVLLDEAMSLRIQTQANRTMVSTYIAPELLFLEDGNECDTIKSAVFSVGVIAFILLTGSVPFEIATIDDPLYALILTNNKRQFWSYFSDNNLSISVQNLLWNMLQSDPNKRCSVSEVRKSEWFGHEVYLQYPNFNEIIFELQNNFNDKESQRAENMSNNEWISKMKATDTKPRFVVDKSLTTFPLRQSEGMFDAYCTARNIDTIYHGLAQFVEESLDGKVHFNASANELICMVSTRRDKIKFKMKVFESKRWKLVSSGDSYSPLFVVRFRRIHGDCYEFIKIKNEHVLKWCVVLNGPSKDHKDEFSKFYGKRVKIKGSYYAF